MSNPLEKLYRLMDKVNLWQQSKIFKRNELVKTVGTVDSNLYYVASGSLKIFFVHKDEEHIVRFGYQNNFIAALDSFITDKPSDFCIEALKSTELKIISKREYLNFIASNLEHKLLWDELLAQLILQQIEREKDLLITSPKERYKRVFKRSPQLFQEVSNKQIAAYLRMTPETLSRLQKS